MRFFSMTLAIIAALAFGPTVLAEEGLWRLSDVDIEVTLEPDQKHMNAEGVLTLRLERAASSTIVLAMNGSERVMRFVDVVCVDAESARLEGALPNRPSTVSARIELSEVADVGDEITVEFGVEIEKEGSQLAVDSRYAIASWIHAWYPCPFDEENTSLAARLATTGTLKMNMPAGWSSLFGGKKISRDEDDSGVVETWQAVRPLAFSFAAGEYDIAWVDSGTRRIAVALLEEKITDTETQAIALADCIDAMEEHLGEFPFDGYGIAEVPDRRFPWYAASQQGVIFVSSAGLTYPGGNIPLFAHEACHAWWGNKVGTRGLGSLLCSESLAQYGAILAIETLEGEEAAREFLNFSRAGYVPNQCARGYFGLLGRGYDRPLAKLDGGPWDHTLSDAKGHWVFHMLRRRVGDEVFFANLRLLIEQYDGRRMSLDDLRRVFVRESPQSARLQGFFSQWLDRPGAPVLEMEWRPSPRGVTLIVRQTQRGAPYDLDLEVEMDTKGGPIREMVEIRDGEEKFEFAGENQVMSVTLDPDHRLLIWRPEYGPKPSR